MGISILIVDDSALTRAFIRRTILMVGETVGPIYEAADGRAGLEQLRRQPVDLLLADLQMPTMDGVQMVRQMWAEPALARTPVVIVSADPNTDRLNQLKAEGAVGYLRKPFTPEEFQRALQPILGNALC